MWVSVVITSLGSRPVFLQERFCLHKGPIHLRKLRTFKKLTLLPDFKQKNVEYSYLLPEYNVQFHDKKWAFCFYFFFVKGAFYM